MRFLLLASAALFFAACTGDTYGAIPDAGAPGYGGGVAAENALLIDPHTEIVYAVKTAAGTGTFTTVDAGPLITSGCDGGFFDFDASAADDAGIMTADVGVTGPTHNEVWSIDPDLGTTRHVSDVASNQYASVTFAESRLFYDIYDSREGDIFQLQDPNTLEILARRRLDIVSTQLADTLSPSEHFIATVGSAGSRQQPLDDGGLFTYASGAIVLTDTRTLDIHLTHCVFGSPHWLHGGDRFLVTQEGFDGAGMRRIHLRLYSVADLQASNFALGPDGAWSAYTADYPVNIESVAISPDDRYVAGDSGNGIDILELATGATRHVADVHEPLFTPSSSMVVGFNGETQFRDGSPTPATRMALVDVATGSVTFVATDFGIAPWYFIASDGHRLVIFSQFDDSQGHIAVADLTMSMVTATTLADTPQSAFGGLVDRTGHGELWFRDRDEDLLRRVDLTTGTIENVPVAFHVASMAYLPRHDVLVFSETNPPAVRFWDPAARSTVRRVAY